MKMSKVGLIVEGDSDKAFFDIYFKPRYGLTRTMKVIPSGTNKKCKIMNTKDMHKNIKSLELKGYKDIYILIDLDSTCKKEVYHCEVELRNDYIAKIGLNKIKNVKVVVASSEIEAWMLSALKKSNKTTKQHLKKEYKVKSNDKLEEILFQKFIASKENIKEKNNDSLCYFLKKLGLVKECK